MDRLSCHTDGPMANGTLCGITSIGIRWDGDPKRRRVVRGRDVEKGENRDVSRSTVSGYKIIRNTTGKQNQKEIGEGDAAGI